MTAVTTPMSIRSLAGRATGARVNAATLALATVCLAVWIASLSRSLFDPIWLDQAIFRYYAERVVAGQKLYEDLFSHNGPTIVGLHWLSIKLLGPSQLAFRVFDALWQAITLAVLVALAARDGRRWHTGLLAATVYMLSYYGFGYTDTADREGYAVLPMLLAVHGVTTAHQSAARSFLSHLAAGLMGFLVFSLKSPLGLCFAVLWLHALADAWAERRRGWRALAGAAGLTSGFVLASAVAVGILIRLDWWHSYVPVLLGRELSIGLIRGPWAIREMMPRMAVAGLLIGAALACTAFTRPADLHGRAGLHSWLAQSRAWIAGLAAFGFLVTLTYWPGWHALFARVMGLLVPAIGAVLACAWHGRSRIWRMVMLLGCASLGAVFLQGNFNTYQIHPALACASYLAACEVAGGLTRFTTDRQTARVWTAICLAGIVHLSICHWWRKMTRCTTAPCVLVDTTLHDHYARVTADRDNVPAYATVRKAAEHIRSSTTPDEPMACLFGDPRLYYLANRPPAHRVVWVCPDNGHLHEDMIRTICRRRPKVLLGRVPPAARSQQDPRTVASAVFDQAESDFGPFARVLREAYRPAAIIDDVCILAPVPSAGP